MTYLNNRVEEDGPNTVWPIRPTLLPTANLPATCSSSQLTCSQGIAVSGKDRPNFSGREAANDFWQGGRIGLSRSRGPLCTVSN